MMMSLEKRTAYLIALFLLFLLSGCSSSKNVSKNPSISEIASQIEKNVDLSEMITGDGEKLKKLYDIESSEIEDFKLYTAPTNIQADEIIIIRLKEEKDAKGIQEKISKRVQDIAVRFKDYLPEEYYIVEKNVVDTKGNYILFVISRDSEKITASFEDSLR